MRKTAAGPFGRLAALMLRQRIDPFRQEAACHLEEEADMTRAAAGRRVVVAEAGILLRAGEVRPEEALVADIRQPEAAAVAQAPRMAVGRRRP